MPVAAQMQDSVPWNIRVLEYLRLLIRAYIHVSIASYSEKFDISTCEFGAQAIVDSDLRVINMHIKLLVFVHSIFDCKSVVLIKRILSHPLPKLHR